MHTMLLVVPIIRVCSDYLFIYMHTATAMVRKPYGKNPPTITEVDLMYSTFRVYLVNEEITVMDVLSLNSMMYR